MVASGRGNVVDDNEDFTQGIRGWERQCTVPASPGGGEIIFLFICLLPIYRTRLEQTKSGGCECGVGG